MNTAKKYDKPTPITLLGSFSHFVHFRPFATKVLLFITLFFNTNLFSQHNEKLVKAVFFEKFSRFIEWNNTESDEFKIAIIGNDSEMENNLKKVYSKHKIQDKPVKIIHLNSIEELSKTSCQILFVSGDMELMIDKITSIAEKKSILTIGDSKNFMKKGVIINFYFKNNSIHFKINQEAAKNANIYISYHLMKMSGDSE